MKVFAFPDGMAIMGVSNHLTRSLDMESFVIVAVTLAPFVWVLGLEWAASRRMYKEMKADRARLGKGV